MMDFELTEEQKLLKTSARDFLSQKCTDSIVRDLVKSDDGYAPQLWKEMAKLGWTGLLIPQEFGGEGATFLETGLLLEEMGRASFPAPFFASAVCSVLLLLEGASSQQKAQLLPPIGRGEKIVVLALAEGPGELRASSISASAARSGAGYAITGTKLPVDYAHAADYFLCAARTGEKKNDISIFLVDARSPGIKTTLVETITGEKRHKVELNAVPVTKNDLIGTLNKGWDVVEKALPAMITAKCMEMVGGAERVLEMTVDYTKTRKQFGHLIGSYQALQHYCANMLLAIDCGKVLTYKAAWLLSKGLPAGTAAAMAKSSMGRAYRDATLNSHQIHGAIAFCEDHALPLYIKRAREAEEMFGSSGAHMETVAKATMK